MGRRQDWYFNQAHQEYPSLLWRVDPLFCGHRTPHPCRFLSFPDFDRRVVAGDVAGSSGWDSESDIDNVSQSCVLRFPSLDTRPRLRPWCWRSSRPEDAEARTWGTLGMILQWMLSVLYSCSERALYSVGEDVPTKFWLEPKCSFKLNLCKIDFRGKVIIYVSLATCD